MDTAAPPAAGSQVTVIAGGSASNAASVRTTEAVSIVSATLTKDKLVAESTTTGAGSAVTVEASSGSAGAVSSAVVEVSSTSAAAETSTAVVESSSAAETSSAAVEPSSVVESNSVAPEATSAAAPLPAEETVVELPFNIDTMTLESVITVNLGARAAQPTKGI